jgi:hypothetical protein
VAKRTNEPILKKGNLVKIKRYYKAEVQNSRNGIVLDIHEGKQASLFPFYDVYVFDLNSTETIWGGDMDLISS